MPTTRGTRKKKRRGGKRRPPSARKRKAAWSPAPRPKRRKPPPPVTSEVLGLRCHVKEIHLLDESLILQDDVDGKQFALPLPTLVGKLALEMVEKGSAVWLSVRLEKERKP